MSVRDDPEDIASRVVGSLRLLLSLPPEAKVLVLIDDPRAVQFGPAALFSQMSYERAIALISSARRESDTAERLTGSVIAAAMGGGRG